LLEYKTGPTPFAKKVGSKGRFEFEEQDLKTLVPE